MWGWIPSRREGGWLADSGRGGSCVAEPSERQAELEALHRSYRMMETDRQKYSEESQNIIKRQRQVGAPPLLPPWQMQLRRAPQCYEALAGKSWVQNAVPSCR